MKRLLLVLPIFLAAEIVSGKEAPPTMTKFNQDCPYQKLRPTLETLFSFCKSGNASSCKTFVKTFRALTVVSDCQRTLDATPRVNYIVPAIWLAGDGKLEDYVQLVANLSMNEAKVLFASPAFRSVLDGVLAEQWLEESLKAEEGRQKAKSQARLSQVLVGIMEDDRSALSEWEMGPPQKRVVRPLFEKELSEWKVSPNHREEIVWTIAFDGKNKGTIRSRPNPKAKDTLLSTDTHVPIPQPGPSLIFGKPSNDFSGWQSTLVVRPLVLISNGNFKDPDGWKSHQLSKDQTKLVVSVFKAEFSVVRNCDESEEPLSTPWRYKDTDITITKSYRSNRGDLLVSAFLQGGRCGIIDGAFQSQYFLLRADKSATRLTVDSRRKPTSDQLSLIMVDAGDYDADGKSEVVFFVTGYNEDGYAIFYDSFRKNVQSTWSYH